MTTNRLRRHGLLCLLGGFVIASLVIATAPETPAQDKKEEKEKTKTAKVEPPPAKFPARKDAIDPAQGGVSHVTLIDEQIQEGWKANNTYPSERCTDYEYIRRASLDIIGRIPTVEEIKKYMNQPESKRRSWLINEMLDGKDYGYGDEYAQNFANLWTVHLLTRSGSSSHAQDQMRDWLYYHLKGDEKGKSPVSPDWSKVVYSLIAAKGETNNENAVNYLLHNLGEEIRLEGTKGPTNTAKNGRWDMIPATSRTTRLFLGIRTQCVQCHNHPFNGEWKQENFWGINAFFREVDTPRNRPTMMVKKKKDKKDKNFKYPDYDLVDNPAFNTSKLVPYEPRNNLVLFTDPTFLDGRKIPKDFKGTRREALAKFVVTSPYMAKAFVNRTWGHFFGKSFTKDGVDDFHEGNPPSYPELLDKLAKDWANDYNHNPKVLIRWICNSQAYGLSSKANKWNDKMDDETLFARMLLKPMSPEQMFESLMIATQAKMGQDKNSKMEAKQEWLNRLIVNFGNDEGEEGNFSGTVVQALLLMNGADINNAISDPKDGAVAAVIKKRGATFASVPFAVDDMFMHVLSRPATQKEKFDMTNTKPGQRMYAFRKDQLNPSAPSPASLPPAFWTAYYQDIMWALVNSNEFILNH